MIKLISSAEIVTKYKISYQILNYYTTLGLLHPETKNRNKRMYDENKLKVWLEKIQKLKNEGYTLGLIRKMLADGSANRSKL